MSSKAVFLDRDGTLIVDKHFLHRPEQVEFFPDTVSALRQLASRGFLLFLVTNQSGVGRGYFTIEDVHRVHEEICARLAPEGIRLERIYIAPESPDQPSRGRKPSPAFLYDARDEFGLELALCYIVGDKLSDLECGWNAGLAASVLVRTGYGTGTEGAGWMARGAVHVAPTLGDAAEWICSDDRM
jgi:D-glycero-D-manno-heptose 1,7-bisphosphate phosphatase